MQVVLINRGPVFALLCPPSGNLKVSQRLVVVVVKDIGGVVATCYLERPLWDQYLSLSLALISWLHANRASQRGPFGTWEVGTERFSSRLHESPYLHIPSFGPSCTTSILDLGVDYLHLTHKYK